MERNKEFAAFIRELMPDSTDEDRAMAGDRLDEYIRILMRIAERMEAAELSQIRKSPDHSV
jgi:hypothetical protein